MTLHIRKAGLEDTAGIASVLRDIGWFTPINAEAPEVTIERIGRFLALALADDSHAVYVAEIEQSIVGYVSVHWLPYLMMAGPEGFISELFVSHGARGQGVGRQLLKVIEDDARTRGCSRLGLQNSRARESYERGFYKKNGWIEREDMISFVLRLDP